MYTNIFWVCIKELKTSWVQFKRNLKPVLGILEFLMSWGNHFKVFKKTKLQKKFMTPDQHELLG